jgi:O-6-methylguanine DNA methyltransferase
MNPIDIEVSFTRFSSPLGWLILASTEKGLCVVQFCGKEKPSETCMRTQLQRILPRSGLRADETPLREAIKGLRYYFGKRCPLPHLPIDLSRGTGFQQKVWAALCSIPFGETRTYGEVAQMIGQPRAARAVGRACGLNPLPIVVPCHRVTAQNYKLGGYTGGIHIKQALLTHEEQSLA